MAVSSQNKTEALKDLCFILMQNRKMFVGWEKYFLPNCSPGGRPAAVSWAAAAWLDRQDHRVYLCPAASVKFPWCFVLFCFPLIYVDAVVTQLQFPFLINGSTLSARCSACSPPWQRGRAELCPCCTNCELLLNCRRFLYQCCASSRSTDRWLH